MVEPIFHRKERAFGLKWFWFHEVVRVIPEVRQAAGNLRGVKGD